MSNFKILGAQRVKALTEMLNEQMSQAIAEIQKEQIKREIAEDIVNKNLGINEQFDEIKALTARISELSEIVRLQTGIYHAVNRNSQYTPEKVKYDTMVNKVQLGDTKERIAKVTAEFKRKEQRLWLCETLEEAKAIVGIE
jgi:CO dehydrogenase/acetyl-CoA synthase delta subunit